jgi:hypothetical protein
MGPSGQLALRGRYYVSGTCGIRNIKILISELEKQDKLYGNAIILKVVNMKTLPEVLQDYGL